MAEPNQFKMPDVGEGLTEADIVKWHVGVGDVVAVNDTVVEVETAKALVELPSPYAGVVTALLAGPGDTVAVGSPIISIADPSDAAETAPAPAGTSGDGAAEAAPEPAAPDEERQTVLVGYGPAKSRAERRPRRKGTGTAGKPATPANPNQRPYATPPVRKLARDLGIDLATVHGTGNAGQITRADLRARADATPPPSTDVVRTQPAEERTRITGVRKHTAQAMVASAFTAPHVTEWLSVDMTRTLELLGVMKGDKEFAGVRLSPLVLVMRAALLALARHPEANAKWDEAAGEIVQYRDVNLGIAAATPRGLVVPNIRAAQSLSTVQLAGALGDLVEQARAGRTSVEAMRDGTFTITNIGVFGVDGGTPILNPGEACILCLGQVRRLPWEHRGQIELRDVGTLTLSFDHRLIDGELGSRLLADIARFLEHPELALAG